MNKIMETFNPDDPKSIENFKLISKEIEGFNRRKNFTLGYL